METKSRPFIPALRFRPLTRYYDRVLAATLKEERFKQRLVEQCAIAPGHRVLDLGCGTGTLTVMLARAEPAAHVTGVDIDPEALAVARGKLRTAGVSAELHQTTAWEAPLDDASFDRVVSSLVLHHLDREEKRRALAGAHRWLRRQGSIHVCDWGRAQSVAMRVAFLGVQLLDGFRTTSDNVHGLLPLMMEEAGFTDVRETHHEATIFGTLALYRGTRP